VPVRLDDFDAARPAIGALEWRRRLAAGETSLGVWLTAGSPVVAELLGASGADWIIVDAEHSAQTLPDIAQQLRALEASPVFVVVRAPSRDPLDISRLLDLGARGVMVPMIESAEHAARAIAAARYPPDGRRGVGAAFARAARWGEVADYLERATEAHCVIPQIESVRAVDAIEEIVTVDGVDAVFVGPADLAASAGLLGQQSHPRVQDMVGRVIAAARAGGVAVGVNAFDLEQVVRYHEQGARFFGVSADVTMLRRSSAALLAELHDALDIRRDRS
jgi:4-hydroxy-2-oxoheptanedioate aldolase